VSAAEIVNKVWNYAHVLRALQNRFAFHQVFPELRSGHDGVGYGDYVEAAPGVLPPAAFEHPCSSQLPINEVPHECV